VTEDFSALTPRASWRNWTATRGPLKASARSRRAPQPHARASFRKSAEEIAPKNILDRPHGVGKTEIAPACHLCGPPSRKWKHEVHRSGLRRQGCGSMIRDLCRGVPDGEDEMLESVKEDASAGGDRIPDILLRAQKRSNCGPPDHRGEPRNGGRTRERFRGSFGRETEDREWKSWVQSSQGPTWSCSRQGRWRIWSGVSPPIRLFGGKKKRKDRDGAGTPDLLWPKRRTSS
jgi:hypothetical protein